MSEHPTDVSEIVHRTVHSAYDDPGTPEEITRRTFMANATLAIGGLVGLGLAIPLVGSLIPTGGAGSGAWAPLTGTELSELEKATATPVKLAFQLRGKDGYLPEQMSSEYVWGIKVDPAKFEKSRPGLFTPAGKSTLPYNAVNLSFVVFSPICPHLGCRYDWTPQANRFKCPCHGSVYTLDGAHVSGPAARGLDPLPLREQSGVAQIMWIRYQATVPDRIVISYQS